MEEYSFYIYITHYAFLVGPFNIERVNYRGTKEQYSQIKVSEDNYSNDNLDCGGYKYA